MVSALLRSGSNSPMFGPDPQTWARDTSPPIGFLSLTRLPDRNLLERRQLRVRSSRRGLWVRREERVDSLRLPATPSVWASNRRHGGFARPGSASTLADRHDVACQMPKRHLLGAQPRSADA